jgi:hypothetical protein
MRHEFDLMASFLVIILIDADGVDPDVSSTDPLPDPAQSKIAVLGDTKGLIVEEDFLASSVISIVVRPGV